MGPLARRLASWGSSGKAMSEVAWVKCAPDAPIGGNYGERLQNEVAILEPIMGNGQ